MATNPPLPPKFNIEDLLYPENPNTVKKLSKFSFQFSLL